MGQKDCTASANLDVMSRMLKGGIAGRSALE